MATSTLKYRPYFTYSELQELSSSLKKSGGSIPLIRYLDKYISDIESGLRRENHALKPTLSQKLELDSPAETSNHAISLSPQQLLIKYSQDPSSCSPKEIEAVQEYRYTHNLMSPEEEREYEKSQGL